MAAIAKNQNNNNEVVDKRLSALIATFKVIAGIILLASIPIFLYNPNLSFGPLDIFRRDFFRTEIILSGEQINSDSFAKVIRSQNKRMVKLFVRSGFDVNGFTSTGVSPLCIAAEGGNLDIIDSILQGDVNLVRKNRSDGLTPVFCAIKSDKVKVVDRFVKSGLSVNTRNEWAEGISPLHYAASLGKDSIVSYLIKSGANVNLTDLTGKTPLHFAVAQSNVVVLYMLLNANADVNIKDDNGELPIDIAARYGNDKYIQIIKNH